MKVSVFFARFPFGNAECPSSANWMTKTVVAAKQNPLIGEIFYRDYDDTPITMTRNLCFEEAKAVKADFVVLLDSDMWPDIGLEPGHIDMVARPFFPTAIEFAVNHPGPCVVAAPYCGPPPHENVYVFLAANKEGQNPNLDFQLDMLSREHAAQRGGFEEVAALPTGLMLVDMRCTASLSHPYFDYEWTDRTNSKKASTEDVYFSRNLALAGVRQYVLWDAWAGHWKRKLVTKPAPWTMDVIRQNCRDAVLRGQQSTERLVMIGGDRPKLSGQYVNHEEFRRKLNPGAGLNGSTVGSTTQSREVNANAGRHLRLYQPEVLSGPGLAQPQAGECSTTHFGAGPSRP